MSADDNDILLKPDTLEMAEGLVEVTLRMIFLYKHVGRPIVRQVQSPQNQTPAHSVQGQPTRIGETVRGMAFGNLDNQQSEQRNMNQNRGQGFLQSAFTKTEHHREEERQQPQNNSPKDSADRRVPSIFAENKTMYTADTAAATSDPQQVADDLSQRINMAQRFGLFQINRAFQS